MLEVKGVSAGYGGAPVLYDVDLVVDRGEIVALLGPNGAGKTTTLRVICGLLRAGSGEVWFDGERIDTRQAEDIVALGMAHSPEGRGVFPQLTVLENMKLGGWTKRKSPGAFDEALSLAFGFFPRLQERADQDAGTLSGGEQQMLAIARSLMSQPKLLLVDEASLGLAPIIVQRLFEIVQEINQMGTTVLMVEQNANFALKVAARAYVLQKGEVIFDGTGEELHKLGVAEVYMGTKRGKSAAPPS